MHAYTHIYLHQGAISFFPSLAYVEFLPQIILARCPGVHNSQWLSGTFKVCMKQVFMLLERRKSQFLGHMALVTSIV